MPSSATLELARLEPEPGKLDGVEELGGEEVALELLLADLDAVDVDRAAELGALAAGQSRLVLGEASAEGRHAGVLTAKPIDEWTGSTS